MADATAQNNWKDRELGALWRRQGKTQSFLSGKLKLLDNGKEREISVVVFKNNYKEAEDKKPDFIIYEDRPRDEELSAPTAKDDILDGEQLPSGL